MNKNVNKLNSYKQKIYPDWNEHYTMVYQIPTTSYKISILIFRFIDHEQYYTHNKWK